MTTVFKRLRKAVMPRTLYARSLMIIVVPILLIQLIVAFVFIDRHWDSMSDKLVFGLVGEIDFVIDQIKAADNQQEVDDIIALATKNMDMQVRLEESTRPMRRYSISEVEWYSVENKLNAALQSRVDYPFQVKLDPSERWFEINVKIDGERNLKFACPNRRLISPTTYIFLLWQLGSAALLTLIAVIFMRNQIRPIYRLSVAAEKLGKGQDVPDFKIAGAFEVRQASRAFLEMRDRIKRQIEQRTTMLAGVSHDLRTPLTRMKLQLAMTKASTENDHLRQDVEEMERMLEGYLTFAKGEGEEQAEMTNLGSVIDRIVMNAKRQGYTIETDIEDRLMIKVKPVAIERAIANIVSNACKYAKNVWLSASELAKEIEIIIDDDGPGIPKVQREEVFKPFYRLEKSRNTKTGGVGLGLSIAQDIVHAHGGEIILEDSARRGLRVVIRLPL